MRWMDERLEGLSRGRLLALARAAVRRAGNEVLAATVGDTALIESVADLHRLETAVHAEKLRRIRAVDERDAHVGRAMSTAGLLCYRLGVGRGEARRLVQVAAALEDLPQVSARLAAGDLGAGHAADIARGVRDVRRAEAAVVSGAASGPARAAPTRGHGSRP